MVRKCLVLLASTSLLSACYSFRGPEPVFERGSVTHRDAVGQRNGYLYELFRRATLNASGCRAEPPVNAGPGLRPMSMVCDPSRFATPEEELEALEAFMDTGFSLIASECSHYFAHMGRRQSGSRMTRDIIAPIGALITGIISIARFESSNTRDNLIASLALGTTAGRSALDVYDQNMLFGSDNIGSVELVTLRALAQHASAAFEARHDTFGKAANFLEENQAHCRPPHILRLVRQSISAGKPQAERSGTADATVPLAEGDDALAPPPAPPPVNPYVQTNAANRESIRVSVPQ